MRIAIATDAWAPQVNGVVTTMRNTRDQLLAMGAEVLMITPDGFRSVPCPGYREIRLSLWAGPKVRRMLDGFDPEYIHIATEGPLGLAARRYCLRRGRPFTTSFHTRFPEYIRMRAPIPVSWGYAFLRRFHAPAVRTLVRTRTQKKELGEKGFTHMKVWPGAVDTELFQPRGKGALDLPRPISLFVGRVAVEKGLDDFLSLELPGTQVVVGGGPALEELRKRYPKAVFLGPKFGEELARIVSAADVFVFPSRTDTFGLVLLEAMACGVPVAAFPVPGPQDLVIDGSTGALDEDLRAATFRALQLDGEAGIEFARDHSWQRSTERLLKFLEPIDSADDADEGLVSVPTR